MSSRDKSSEKGSEKRAFTRSLCYYDGVSYYPCITGIRRDERVSYMKCTVCGFDVPEGASICPVCGMKAAASKPEVRMAENERQEAMSPGNKYSMAGGVTAASNPFGMDPSNQEARAAQEEARRQMEMDARILDEPGAGQPPYEQQQRPLDLSAFDSGLKPFGGISGTSGARPRTPSNNNKILVIVTCAVLVVVLAVIALWRAGVFDGHKMNGTYTFERAEAFGRAYSPEELQQMGTDVRNFQLTIKGGKATVRLMGRTGTSSISFDDGKVVLTEGDSKMYGTYNETEGTISIDVTGLTLVFKRQ